MRLYASTQNKEDMIYDKMVLVNKSTYIAKTQDGWKAVGEQFAVPYVYKTLFSIA